MRRLWTRLATAARGAARPLHTGFVARRASVARAIAGARAAPALSAARFARAAAVAVVGAGAAAGSGDGKPKAVSAGRSGSGIGKSAVTGLSAVVIRTDDIAALRDWYERLGLHFELEKHGGGPRHYSAVVNGVVFEIYPSAQPKPNADGTVPPRAPADSTTRLSFTVADVDALYHALTADAESDAGADADPATPRRNAVTIVSRPTETEFGRAFVVRDLDGRSVELVQAPEPVRVARRALWGLPMPGAATDEQADAMLRSVAQRAREADDFWRRLDGPATAARPRSGADADADANANARAPTWRMQWSRQSSREVIDPDTGKRVRVTTVNRNGDERKTTTVIGRDGVIRTFDGELSVAEAIERAENAASDDSATDKRK